MRREQFQRYKQYLFSYFRHMTFQKVSNLLQIESSLFRNNPDIKGLFPYFLIVEISNKCNLYCPLCQMGQRQTITRTNRMNLENYRKFITPLKGYLFQVFLYNWGEPFLNKDIYNIISFNTQNNIGSAVSTNFNIPIDSYKLIDSGLEHLIISCDGVTQDVYVKYRKGGDITRVFHNLQSLIKAKKRRKTKLPFIEWQCLVTKHNETQLKTIKRTALKMGVNRVRFANINFYSTNCNVDIQEEWLPKNSRYRSFASEKSLRKRKRGIRRPCFWLWRGAIVNVNGGITPCCLYDVPDWGNAFQDDFSVIWNNEIYCEARELSQNNAALHKRSLICDRCTAPFIYR